MDLKNTWAAELLTHPNPISLTSSEGHYQAISVFQKKNSELWFETTRSAENEFYWASGTYGIEINVQTHTPSKIFCFSFSFDLTDEDVEVLRANVVKMLFELCGVTNPGYGFAWPKLTPRT